jgi:endoglycosylceramidase
MGHVSILKNCLFGLTSLSLAFSALARDMSFDATPAAAEIRVGKKTYAENGRSVTDYIYQDALGREVVMRGWAIGAAAKLMSMNRMPYLNVDHAREDLDNVVRHSGANVIRFAFEWDAITPEPNVIDYAHLDALIAQIKEATRRRIYVLPYYDQEMFSRFMFNKNSRFQGMGAPKYLVRPEHVGNDFCAIPCITWTMHFFVSPAARGGQRDFWNNATVNGHAVQDTFMWQLGATLRYVKERLTPEEFRYVVGLDSYNEPIDDLGGTNPFWDDNKLWPFHQRVRQVMDASGWQGKSNFAEPNLMWNTQLLPVPTPGVHLTAKPGDGYVFNAHYYDIPRLAGTNILPVKSGEYFSRYDDIRAVGRKWGSPTFVSEFGAPQYGTGVKDPSIQVNHQYAALDGSRLSRTSAYLAPYAPVISSTQWNWNYYHDRNREYMNGNPNKLLVKGDAWNDESLSVVDYSGGTFRTTYDPFVTLRPYPKRVQGHIMNFQVNTLSKDKAGKLINGIELRPQASSSTYLKGQRFALLTWRGKNSTAPSELFIPNGYGATELAVITDREIRIFNGVDANASNVTSTISLLQDAVLPGDAKSGYRLMIWDDASQLGEQNEWHYALVVQRKPGQAWDSAVLSNLQRDLNKAIVMQHQNPAYMLGALK